MFAISPLIDLFLVLFTCLRLCFKFGDGWCHNPVCLQGKVALVTGGSSGIGYQTVKSLLSRGCKVIIADKIVDEKIKQALIQETKNSNINFEYVDMASFKSVRQLAEKLMNSETKLDILINNAGIVMGPKTLSEDGLNFVMQINYFSGFLLTHLLVDLLKKSTSGRIIFTSSLSCLSHRITPDNIDPQSIRTEAEDFVNYANSKFCLLVASDMFAEKLKKYKITSNTYHPGLAKTSLIQNCDQYFTSLLDQLTKYMGILFVYLLAKSAERGAQTAIHLATANEVENVTGGYFWEMVPARKPKAAADKVLCSMIWQFSENIVGLKEKESL